MGQQLSLMEAATRLASTLKQTKNKDLGGRAHARRSDPETSHAAARSTGELRESQQAVLSVIASARQPLTDEAIIRLYNVSFPPRPPQSESGIRSRRSELVALGRVVHDGYGKTRSGRKSRKWRAA